MSASKAAALDAIDSGTAPALPDWQRTMYELANMQDALLALVADQDGEITPEQEALWDQVQEKFETKVEKSVLFLHELDGEAERIKAQEERLAARRKAVERDAQRIRSLLLDRMQRFGKAKVKTPLASAWLAETQAFAELVSCDQADLRSVASFAPQFVKHVPESFSWDKNAVKDAAKAGPLPEDIAKRCTIVTNIGLRIR